MFAQLTTETEKSRLLNLLASYGIKGLVLSSFEAIPREFFIEETFQESAYEDRALPIGEGQTISQPSLVGTMLQALKLQENEKVLEIGTGSGFQAALLGKLAKEVYTIERIPKLAQTAAQNLKNLKITNVKVVVGDGTLGLKRFAPFDAIIVTAAFTNVPAPLVKQLRETGRLIMPVGDQNEQEVVLYKKAAGKLIPIRKIAPVRFVPLIGKHAWDIANGAH